MQRQRGNGNRVSTGGSATIEITPSSFISLINLNNASWPLTVAFDLISLSLLT